LNVIARELAGSKFLVNQTRRLRGRLSAILWWPELLQPARETFAINPIQNLCFVEGA
jgi:hypothetical protein